MKPYLLQVIRFIQSCCSVHYNLLLSVIFQNLTEHRKRYSFANDEDLNGAAVALTRLQDTYELKTSDVAEGILLGTQYSSSMSVEDCFEMGKQLKAYGDNYYALLWLQEAFKRNEQSRATSKNMKIKILESLHPILSQENYTAAAVKVIDELTNINSGHTERKENENILELQVYL
jgi:prolyl 4-hydroxylase